MADFAADGMTYYVGQQFRGIGGTMAIVDVSDPSNPKQLPTLQFPGNGRPHGVWLNPKGFARGVPEGDAPVCRATRPARPDAGPVFVRTRRTGDPGRSDYQFRRPNPEIRIISTLF
jgi:hypothetical protein